MPWTKRRCVTCTRCCWRCVYLVCGREGGGGGSDRKEGRARQDTDVLQTQIMEGKLVCGNCGHEYNIHQGIANFLLPNHLGTCASSTRVSFQMQ